MYAEVYRQGILHANHLVTLFAGAPLRRLVQYADGLLGERTVGRLKHLNIGQTAVLLDHERENHTTLDTVFEGDLRELHVLLHPVAEGIEVSALYLIEILHQTTTLGLILIDKVLLTGCLPL